MRSARHLEEEPMPDLSNAPLEPWVKRELPAGPKMHEWTHRFRKRVCFTDIYSECRREMRQLNKIRQRKAAGLPARPQQGEAPSAVGQAWLLEQFQGFLQQLQQQLSAAPAGDEPPPAEEQEERIRPVRTPRSGVPLAAAKPAELLPAKFQKGRLYFSCPGCRFPAVLPRWLAGEKVRCPRCYGALRAPHPRRGLKTRVLENDIEVLLHPERFSQYYHAHRLIPWLGLPRPKFNPSFHTGAVAVLLVLLCLWVPSLLERAGREMSRLTALVHGPHVEEGPGFRHRARQTVEQFLAAEGIEAKAACVRDPARVAPLMTDWYQRHPGAAPLTPRSVEVSGAGFYSGASPHPVSDVRVELPDGEVAYFTVEHLPDGDRIEWESSVGYSADFSALLQRGPSAGPQPVRVMAAFDDYYNYAFTDPETHLCLRFHDPATLEFLGYGYLPADAPGTLPLLHALDGSSAEDLRPLQLEIEAVENGTRSRQVRIHRMIQSGWRTGTAVAGPVVE